MVPVLADRQEHSGQCRLSTISGARFLKAKLEADPHFYRNREVFTNMRSGTTPEKDREA
jgi:hypothetical protein